MKKNKTIQNIQAIVLAAGKSSRFNTSKTKLSYKICGQEIIAYPLTLLSSFNIPTIVIVGHKKEEIKNIIEKYNFKNINYCEQSEQLGTGHAVQCAQSLLNYENILIINGDMPLVKPDIIENLVNIHQDQNSTISFVTAYNPKTNNSYGRVKKNNNKIQIIEVKELRQQNKNLDDYKYINAGIYLIKKDFLVDTLNKLKKSKVSQELYITDLVKIASDNNLIIKTIEADLDSLRGINTQQELFEAEKIKKLKIIESFMANGVRFKDINSIDIDINITIEPGTTIEANVKIKEKSYIGANSIIESGSTIINSYIEKDAIIKQNSVIENSKVKSFAQIGPFAQVRKNSTISEYAFIGNFVEISSSIIGQNTKAKHLAYIGNSEVGQKVNVGAGTITCNYNGITKNKTIIKDNAFIGSNSSLIAPVTIGKNAIVAAGSVITKDIPDNALVIARSREVIKENYVSKFKILSNKKDKLCEK